MDDNGARLFAPGPDFWLAGSAGVHHTRFTNHSDSAIQSSFHAAGVEKLQLGAWRPKTGVLPQKTN